VPNYFPQKPTTESEIEIIESSHAFDICDVSCQTENNYETYKDLKAEINVLKGVHQAELNRYNRHKDRTIRLHMSFQYSKSASSIMTEGTVEWYPSFLYVIP
jgi:hypothetical protein